MECGRCGAENRAEARFCDACGTPTAAGESTSAPATGAVRKTVTVAKFMGDGMMALFGIPEIAEDDARRAVLAGLEAQTRFAAFAAEVAAQHGEPLTLRVGVNTGEVVLAEGDADLVGDALNVAARLEKACRSRCSSSRPTPASSSPASPPRWAMASNPGRRERASAS